MDLRETLFDAVLAGDLDRVEELCRTHRDDIIAAFGEWQMIPEVVRADDAAMQRYATALITIARIFAEKLGDGSLMQRLIGEPDDNPMTRWEAELHEAMREMTELEFTAAGRRLQKLLTDTRDLRGSGPDQLRPITIGYIGECFFQKGDAENAIPFLRDALTRMEVAGNADGVIAYLGNLYEVHRYLGRGSQAAGFADALAKIHDQLGHPGEASDFRKRAARAREGEPRNRVVAMLDEGALLELDEVTSFGGRIRFSFERDRLTLKSAAVIVERGERAGAEGRFEDALELFRGAAEVDPHFPHARYQEGFTLLLLRRYAEAVTAFAATDGIAPGWFNCRADLWLARELAAGRITHEAFLALREIEDGPASPADKLALADKALELAPDLPGLHLERGRQLARLGRTAEACAAFRETLARDPEPDVRTRVLVQLAVSTTEPGERRRLLEEAVQLDGNIVAAATARLALRSDAAAAR